MKRIIVLLIVFSAVVAFASSAYAHPVFDKESFMKVLEQYNAVMAQINQILAPNPKGVALPSDSDEIWLKADDINAQLERMINGINTVKGVAVALGTITNLYNSGQISADVAFAMITTLKQRAVFIKIFITNGSDELEVLISILTDREHEFSSKLSGGVGKPEAF